MKEWSYFNKFEPATDKYLPAEGQGDTIATQTVTAVTKLVYKWYNDGDVYDNVNSPMAGWCNDLSSYANWLWNHHQESRDVLARISKCYGANEYEDILADLADLLLDDEVLEKHEGTPADGSIYKCDGPFEFSDEDEYDEDEYAFSDEEDDEDWEDEEWE